MRRLAIAIPLLGLASCHDDRPASAVTLEVDGVKRVLRYGKAFPHADGLMAWIADEPITCDGKLPEHKLRMTLSPGPGGAFFAGAPAAHEVAFSIGDDTVGPPSFARAVKLDPFEAKPGKRVRGAISLRGGERGHTFTASGDFDVEICDDKKGRRVSPMRAEAGGEVKGTFAGEPYTFRSAIAQLGEDPFTHEAHVQRIVLSPDAGRTCGSSGREGDTLLLFSLGGAGEKDPAIGAAQPANATLSSARGAGGIFAGRTRSAWVRFDRLDIKPYGSVAGSFSAESGPGADADKTGAISGAFTARICPEIDQLFARSEASLTVNREAAALKYGRAWLTRDGIQITLTSTPAIRCGGVPQSLHAISFLIPPGPGKAFFAGSEAALRFEVWHPALRGVAPGASAGTWRSALHVKLDKVKAAEGERVRGKLEGKLEYRDPQSDASPPQPIAISGAFDVEICPDEGLGDKLAALPEEAPAGEVSGSLGGAPFAPKVVLATLGKERRASVEALWRLDLYDDPRASCEKRDGERLSLTFPGGADKAAPLLGSPQPALGRARTAKGELDLGPRAWIRWDSVEYRAGGAATGALVIATSPGAPAEKQISVGGSFRAKVCPPAP